MRESLIQRDIIKYLQLRGFKVYKISDRFRSGIPDIYAIRNGWACWIEVKAPGGRLTKLQQYEIDQLRDAGATVLVARSTLDCKVMLDGVVNWQSLQEIIGPDGSRLQDRVHHRLPLRPAPAHAERSRA